MRVFIHICALVATSLVPTGVSAATFADLAGTALRYLNAAAVTIISATVALYLYRTARGLFNLGGGSKPDDFAKARKALLEGIGILFVMLSVWGILNLLIGSLLDAGWSF